MNKTENLKKMYRYVFSNYEYKITDSHMLIINYVCYNIKVHFKTEKLKNIQKRKY